MKQTICDLISYWASQETISAAPGVTGLNGANGRSGKDAPLCEDVFYSGFASADWPAVYRELQDQSIAYLFTDLIEGIVSDELERRWTNAAMYNMHRFSEIQNAQQELYKLLSANGIEMAVLKGTAAAVNYPKPEYRSMGDVDFLVPIEKFDMAYHLMRNNGYVLIRDEDHTEYHYKLEKEGVIFELHRYPAGMRADDEYLFELFQDGLKNVQLVPCETYDVPVLQDLQNGLVLLLHIVHHLDIGLGFRQIIDWMMFVDKHLTDDAYRVEFKPVFEQAGLDVMAKTVTKMCQMYLGLRRDITWCFDADDALCTTLLDYFYEQGNFGVKVRDVSATVNAAAFFSNKPREQFRKLQKHGMKNWELAKKYTWLRPFAWLYQLFLCVKMAVDGEYNVRGMRRDISDGKYRKQLIESLKVFESS